MGLGDLEADYFYVIEEGSMEIGNVRSGTKNAFSNHFVDTGEGSTEPTDLRENAAEKPKLGPGDSFGEYALLLRSARVMTVTAMTNSKLWAIDRHDLHDVLQGHTQQRLEKAAGYLAKVELFKELQKEELHELADCLVEISYDKGQCVFEQGDQAYDFYMLVDGSVEVVKDGEKVCELTGDPEKKQEHFGETGLINDAPRSATIRCSRDRSVMLTLKRDDFKKFQLVVEHRKCGSMGSQSVGPGQIQYKRCDLKEVRKLGHGAFGLVTLQEHTPSGVTFALKSLSKGHIVSNQQERCVVNEKVIMRVLSSPFLIRLAAVFNESKSMLRDASQSVEFLMEAATGGTLNDIYHNRALYGKSDHARFYAACAARGLEYMHERHIMYRDMKAENLLLDAKGYCKIADFGLSKFCFGRAYTFCGTPDYMAPEFMGTGGHTLAADWWSLGALLFELMDGSPPFIGEDPMVILKNASQGMDHVKFPSDGPWAEMVRDLCQVDPQDRLPMRNGGMGNFEVHPWYTEEKPMWVWKIFEKRAMKAPYKPPPSTAGTDASCDGQEPPIIPYSDDGSGWDRDLQDTIGPEPAEFKV